MDPQTLPESRPPASAATVDTPLRAATEVSADPPAGSTVASPPGFGRAPELPADPPAGFTVEGELGRGGMGVVYLARQGGLNRLVALKMMLGADPKGVIRFLAESEAVAAVRHPNVVEVYQYGETDGRPFLVLEYCPGGSLDATTPREPPSDPADIRAAAGLMAEVADGVEAAHSQGIVHRDLKPHNVLIADGTPKVTDFGLAKRGEGGDLTRTNAVMGTPAYMPPEQARGDTRFVGPQADVWSLGVMLYERVCGRRPFPGDDLWQVLGAVQRGQFPRPRAVNPAVPRDLELICLKCLDPDAIGRYASAGGLAADLRNWLVGRPISARSAGPVESVVKWVRRNTAVAAAMVVAVVALVAGTAVSGWQAVRASDEARNARDAERTARQKTAEAEASTEQFRLAGIRTHDQVIRGHLSTSRIFLDRGDYSSTLHWVAKAWLDDAAALEPGARLDPQREANHRLRFGDALEKFARPVSLCLHDTGVHEAELALKDEFLVTLAEDGRVRVWQTDKSELAYPPLTEAGKGLAFALSPGGALVAVSESGGTVKLWQVSTGEAVAELAHPADVLGVAFHPDGETLATASGNAVTVWNVVCQAPERVIDVGEPVDFVAYSSDGRYLATAGPGERAFVWDAATGQRLSEALRHTRPPLRPGGDADHLTFVRRKRPLFSPDGKYLVTTDDNGLNVWSAGKAFGMPFPNPQQGLLADITFAETVPLGTADKAIAVLRANPGDVYNYEIDLASRLMRPVLVKYNRQRAGIRLSADGRLTAVPISNGTLFVRDRVNHRDVCEPILCTKPVTAFRFVSPGNRLLVASLDGSVRLFELPGEQPQRDQYQYDCGRADLLRLSGRVLSPDGRIIARMGPEAVALRDREADKELRNLDHPKLTAALFSPTGEFLATTGATETKVWRVADGEAVATLPFSGLQQSSQPTGNWAWSEDGKRFAVVARKGPLHVYGLPDGKQLLEVPTGYEYPWGVSLSADGQYVAVSNFLDRVARWDVNTQRPLPELNLSKDAVSIDRHHGRDGRLLTVASDMTVRQWKADEAVAAGPTIRLPAAVNDGFYSPDQRRIAVMYDQVVQVFDADSGELLASRSFAPQRNLKVWWAKDGSRLTVHNPNSEYARTWRLQSFGGSPTDVSALVSLAAGTRFDPVEGIAPIDPDDWQRRRAEYLSAWRAWRPDR